MEQTMTDILAIIVVFGIVAEILLAITTKILLDIKDILNDKNKTHT